MTAVTLCDPDLLRRAARTGTLGDQRPVDVEGSRRGRDSAAHTTGLTQVVGKPLGPHETLEIRNDVSDAARLTIKTYAGGERIEATFERVPKGKTLRVQISDPKEARSVALRYGGRMHKPDATRKAH